MKCNVKQYNVKCNDKWAEGFTRPATGAAKNIWSPSDIIS